MKTSRKDCCDEVTRTDIRTPEHEIRIFKEDERAIVDIEREKPVVPSRKLHETALIYPLKLDLRRGSSARMLTGFQAVTNTTTAAHESVTSEVARQYPTRIGWT
jgi:hypothetical protein